MIEFVLLGKLIDRKADNITLIAFVCALMILYDPIVVTNIGFQLSFIVTFSLLFCTSIFMEKAKTHYLKLFQAQLLFPR